jgi:hypothetical protein
MKDGTYLKLNGTFILSHAKTGYWVAIGETTLDDTLDGHYVGVWTNPETDEVFCDRSVWVADLDTAGKLAIQFVQKAIWDCENETEIWTYTLIGDTND